MRHVRHHRRPPARMGVNLTPLVDVIFMLTIFFMLVTRFSSAEQVPMQLPKPDHSHAKVVKMPERVVLNCRLAAPMDDEESAVLYSIGPNQPESLPNISDRLAAMKLQSPDMKVVVRADRRIHYAQVRAAMRVIARNNIEMLNVVAHVSEDE